MRRALACGDQFDCPRMQRCGLISLTNFPPPLYCPLQNFPIGRVAEGLWYLGLGPFLGWALGGRTSRPTPSAGPRPYINAAAKKKRHLGAGVLI